jgi:DNA primase
MLVNYPEEIIEEIRVNNDIVELAQEYVKLERKGKDYFGLCPFHKEKTPSFSVVPSKQIFYCFGCGKGGNVIQLVMYAENLDFIEALKLLADRARISLPENSGSLQTEKVRLKDTVLRVNKEAAKFFFSSLKSDKGKSARAYLERRGIKEKTAIRFGIGFSCGDWDSLFKYLLSKGFNEESIAASGLVSKKKTGGYYDRFRDRIMFPISDLRGNIIGFGGRVLDGSQPKYLNSPETIIFNKRKNLYGLNYAKRSGLKKLIVVEGYMDVISLHQSGIINAVASLGTALTQTQGRLLNKYAEEIIISFDSDTAGQAAAMRGIDILGDMGANVKVLSIPDRKDPDEYVRNNGPKAFERLLDSAQTLLEYKIAKLKGQIDTASTEGQIQFLSTTAAVRLRSHYMI